MDTLNELLEVHEKINNELDIVNKKYEKAHYTDYDTIMGMTEAYSMVLNIVITKIRDIEKRLDKGDING